MGRIDAIPYTESTAGACFSQDFIISDTHTLGSRSNHSVSVSLVFSSLLTTGLLVASCILANTPDTKHEENGLPMMTCSDEHDTLHPALQPRGHQHYSSHPVRGNSIPSTRSTTGAIAPPPGQRHQYLG